MSNSLSYSTDDEPFPNLGTTTSNRYSSLDSIFNKSVSDDIGEGTWSNVPGQKYQNRSIEMNGMKMKLNPNVLDKVGEYYESNRTRGGKRRRMRKSRNTRKSRKNRSKRRRR